MSFVLNVLIPILIFVVSCYLISNKLDNIKGDDINLLSTFFVIIYYVVLFIVVVNSPKEEIVIGKKTLVEIQDDKYLFGNTNETGKYIYTYYIDEDGTFPSSTSNIKYVKEDIIPYISITKDVYTNPILEKVYGLDRQKEKLYTNVEDIEYNEVIKY